MARQLRLVAAVCIVMTLAGCLGNPVRIRTNEEFSKSLRKLADTVGKSVPLQELTDFPWDHVYVFTEAASAEVVNGKVGQPVLAEGSFYTEAGNLFVFTDDGNVVKALSVVPDLLYYGNRHTWGPKVRLKTDGGTINLVEPSQPGEDS